MFPQLDTRAAYVALLDEREALQKRLHAAIEKGRSLDQYCIGLRRDIATYFENSDDIDARDIFELTGIHESKTEYETRICALVRETGQRAAKHAALLTDLQREHNDLMEQIFVLQSRLIVELSIRLDELERKSKC